jgi:hypothetical protein
MLTTRPETIAVPERKAEDRRVDRMTHEPVRPGAHELVIGLDHHFAAPVAPEMHARPDVEQRRRRHDRESGRRVPPSLRNKTPVQPRNRNEQQQE